MRSRVLRQRLREKVVVTLKDGAAFAGVLYDDDGKVLVLRQAEVIDTVPGNNNTPVDGELLLYAVDVAYLQRP